MSTFGHWLRVTTFGESHGPYVGVTLDGFPSGEPFPFEAIQKQLDRRRPGQSAITSPRSESDRFQVISGLQQMEEPHKRDSHSSPSPSTNPDPIYLTLGSPITLLISNMDKRPQDYAAEGWTPRPGHADLTYCYKYGLMAKSGEGRASARETAGRVAAGALAEAYLKRTLGIDIVAYVSSVGPYSLSTTYEAGGLTREQVDASMVRCPEPRMAEQMKAYIESLQSQGDSTGGSISCIVRQVPAGLGEPVFDKLTARLAYAMMSIPSSRGFEMGRGFEACSMKGSEHNDPLTLHQGQIEFEKNDAGGTLGGISTGSPLLFRVAFKPPSTIRLPQASVQRRSKGEGHLLEPTQLASIGRHDPCVVPRAVPIVEAMTALTLIDLLFAQKAKMNDQQQQQPIHYGHHFSNPL